jgi:hypothetical protein
MTSVKQVKVQDAVIRKLQAKSKDDSPAALDLIERKVLRHPTECVTEPASED